MERSTRHSDRLLHTSGSRVDRPRDRRPPLHHRYGVPVSKSRPKRVFVLCHYCGWTPPDKIPQDGVCPKCKGHSWERFALSEALVPAHMK